MSAPTASSGRGKRADYRTFRWPAGLRIVVASRLGSEGQDVGGFDQPSFDPSTYQDVKIYQQPDRTKPGFNPNEEHARIYPSLHASLNGATVPVLPSPSAMY